MVEETLQNQVDEIRALLVSRLHARGATLAVQVRKAGRRLPRRLRQNAETVIEAIDLIENPKLARMLDPERAHKAAQNIINHLHTIDPKERFMGHVLGILGAISAAMIFIFVLTVYVLVKRGLL